MPGQVYRAVSAVARTRPTVCVRPRRSDTGGVVVVVVVVVVDVTVVPVHGVPLSAKSVGAGFEPVHEPLKPNPALAPVPRRPFQLTLSTWTRAPDWLTVPFQSWVTFWPAANDHVSRQLATGSPRLVTLAFAPKPPDHWLVTW